jgi:hypothetical protein
MDDSPLKADHGRHAGCWRIPGANLRYLLGEPGADGTCVLAGNFQGDDLWIIQVGPTIAI